MNLRDTLTHLHDRLHLSRSNSRLQRNTCTSGAPSPLNSQAMHRAPSAFGDALAPHVPTITAPRAQTPIPSNPAPAAPAREGAAPQVSAPVAAPTPPPATEPSYKYMNPRALFPAVDAFIGKVEDCASLGELNAAMKDAQDALQTVHPRIANHREDAAKRIANAAIGRAVAGFNDVGPESDIDQFTANTTGMGIAALPEDLVANLRWAALMARDGDTLDACASTLKRIANDMGGEPQGEAALTARQSLIDNLTTWTQIARYKLPASLPYMRIAFDEALAELTRKTGVDLKVELDMPTDADNAKKADDLYKSDLAQATAGDEELARALAEQIF